ncbi:MAG: PH domain-containing protein [Desulfatiglans sp.]|jgi:membrane protein YdbS with pleckstrin-like domain|nr:PH domain-containing protein [Desulfatiglans sp.]
MSQAVDRAAARFYEGFWGILTRWFIVPAEPPSLPVHEGEKMDSFRPSPGFLRYMKFKFWVVLTLIDVLIIVPWLILTIFKPLVGLVLAPIVLAIAFVPDIFAYLAIHLRYDTTWYVMTERSMRIRRGIWIINEITITFENIQNVTIKQGPLQRFFGISDIRVQTAGGGSGGHGHQHGAEAGFSHEGILEGIANAITIRDLILNRLKKSKSAGLGDEEHHRIIGSGWLAEHVAVLSEIRGLIRKLR